MEQMDTWVELEWEQWSAARSSSLKETMNLIQRDTWLLSFKNEADGYVSVHRKTGLSEAEITSFGHYDTVKKCRSEAFFVLSSSTKWSSQSWAKSDQSSLMSPQANHQISSCLARCLRSPSNPTIKRDEPCQIHESGYCSIVSWCQAPPVWWKYGSQVQSYGTVTIFDV